MTPEESNICRNYITNTFSRTELRLGATNSDYRFRSEETCMIYYIFFSTSAAAEFHPYGIRLKKHFSKIGLNFNAEIAAVLIATLLKLLFFSTLGG